MEYVDGLNLRQLEQAGKLSPRRDVLLHLLLLCMRVLWRGEAADLRVFLKKGTHQPIARRFWRWVFYLREKSQ